jgi:hypothetical protein
MSDASKPDTKKPLCFVIGPIGKDGTPERKHSDLLLHSVIKQVLHQPEFGYLVKRADEDADPGMIGDRMISDIIHADLVVADLTDLNANAFYELGIRHSTEKPAIHIARLGTVLPFDNVTHRTIFVDLMDWHSTEQARQRLGDSARAIKALDFKISNPITQANASFTMRQSADPRDRVIAEMQERMSALEIAISRKATIIMEDPRRSRDASLVAKIVAALQNDDDISAVEVYQTAMKVSASTASQFVEAVSTAEWTRAFAVHSSQRGVSGTEALSLIANLRDALGE